jgi:hypothetical protein
MIKWIANKWNQWCDVGLKLPFMHDPVTKSPSITLIFPYITFGLSIASVITLHFKPQLTVACWTTLGFWVLATALYMLRKITKLKFDKGGIELDSGDIEDKKEAPASKVDSPEAQ